MENENQKEQEVKNVKIANEKNTGNTNETENSKEKNKKAFCIASMVLGIVSIVMCCSYGISIICGILAVVFGILGIKSEKKGMAISGITTGAIGIIISIVMLIILIIMGFSASIFDILDNYRYKDDDIEIDMNIEDILPKININNTIDYDNERYY